MIASVGNNKIRMEQMNPSQTVTAETSSLFGERSVSEENIRLPVLQGRSAQRHDKQTATNCAMTLNPQMKMTEALL